MWAAVAALKQRDEVLEAALSQRRAEDSHAAAYLNQLSSDSDDEVSLGFQLHVAES